MAITSMKLLDLNDDILSDIFAHLHGKDALSVALTSRRLHGLAIDRVFAVVECRSMKELARLHSYVVSTSPPRARHIFDLEIVLSSMLNYPPRIKAAITDPLTELLDQTLKIRRLVLHGYFISQIDGSVCAAIARALRAMSRLAELSIDHLCDAVLPVCASLPQSLRKLSLGFVDREWHGWHHSYDPYINILASLPHLHTLDIDAFLPRRLYSSDSPTLPSLRNLTFRDVSLLAVDLVALAPNLQQISITSHLQREAWEEETTETWNEPPRPWPPVRRLEFNTISTLSPFLDALSPPADYLKIAARTSLNLAPELISVFRTISPVGADLFLSVGEDPASFWREVADAAPRLRYLRLSLTVKNSSDSWMSWMNDLAASLRAIPLVYLKIRPHLKVRKKDLKKNTTTQGSKQKSKSEALLDLERERTREMIHEASARLPQLLADAIPTLTFFELGIPGGNFVPKIRYARWEDADTSRWWRIVSGEDGRYSQDMWEGEGRRVLAFLEDTDEEDIERLRTLFPL